MRSKPSRLLRVVLLLLLTSVASATTWYVNGVSGSDVNNCMALATSCKTIGHATSLAASGDTIKIAAATYTENVRIVLKLTLVGSGASTTIINGGVGTGIGVSINLGVGPVTLSGVSIIGGRALAGAGIYNQGTLTITNSTISGNTVISNCNILLCSTVAYGGGIDNLGTLTINNSTITSNSARRGGRRGGAAGGGIFNQGRLMINNCTLNANLAYRGVGGGIANVGTVKISNSTIDGNNSFYGNGGNIFNIDGTVILQNSIVADSSSGGNCDGTMTSNGYNLSSDATCDFKNTGDLNNTDPVVGPLQNNGGPTRTMALPSGSPAVDAGNPNGCTDNFGHLLKTDQRGMPRPDKEDTGGCDMGAYERQQD